MWGKPDSTAITVIGAGAVGGLIGGKMALAGADVTLIDQGEQLTALTERGLTLVHRDGEQSIIDDITVAATHREQHHTPDILVVGVKAYDLAAIAPTVSRISGPRTTVLPVQNGIPWWYFYEFGGEFEGHRMATLDPDGTVTEHIDIDQVVGCVPFVAGTVSQPGIVRHDEGEWFPVGELDGAETDRVNGIADLFEQAGLRSRVLDDVRSELWLKELGNLAFNPISALTGATLESICRNPQTRALARRMMTEAKPVAEELGVEFRRSIEDRIDGAEAVGAHKTSMLQDIERGNPLETDALLGSVIELADLTDCSVPTIESVYGLVSLLEETQTNHD